VGQYVLQEHPCLCAVSLMGAPWFVERTCVQWLATPLARTGGLWGHSRHLRLHAPVMDVMVLVCTVCNHHKWALPGSVGQLGRMNRYDVSHLW
jgi:hypothetical protein